MALAAASADLVAPVAHVVIVIVMITTTITVTVTITMVSSIPLSYHASTPRRRPTVVTETGRGRENETGSGIERVAAVVQAMAEEAVAQAVAALWTDARDRAALPIDVAPSNIRSESISK